MFSTMLGDLHTHLDTLDNALKRRPIVSYFDGTTSIAVLRVSLPPQSGNTRSSDYLFLMNDGSKIVACSVDTPEKSWDDASSILTKYFKIFGDVPGRIPLSFQRDYSILMRMPVSLLPADNDLLLKMGQAKTVRSSYALPNPTVFVGDSAAEKIAFAEFYIKTGRTPLNREEFERGEPFEVVFPRFGVKLPYMTGIPQQCQALGNKTVSVRDEGLGEAASSTIFYKVPIRFDPARREFREETFFDKPFVPRPDGLKHSLPERAAPLLHRELPMHWTHLWTDP